MSDARLPAHLEVSALIRATEVRGGVGTVIHKGDRDAGTILLLTMKGAENPRLWERLPRLDGSREFASIDVQDTALHDKLGDYLARRTARDNDIWIVELNIAEPERLIAEFSR